jgi:hypothetical protein
MILKYRHNCAFPWKTREGTRSDLVEFGNRFFGEAELFDCGILLAIKKPPRKTFSWISGGEGK